MKATNCLIASAVGLLSAVPSLAQTAGAGASVPERVAALKQSLAQSQQSLRAYQWVETTTVSYKGEQKSFKQESCYYGADGALQKTLIASSPPPTKKPGLRGKIAESKKEEMTDTMKQAVALVKSYVPPDPALIERAVNAGKASVEIVQPGKVVRVVFRDYRLPGDALSITMDLTNNRLTGINVATYLGKPSHPVDMNATMGTLADGTTYTAATQLGVKSAKLVVDVANSGYRRVGAM